MRKTRETDILLALDLDGTLYRGGKLFVLHVDKRDRLLGRRRTCRRHRCHGLSDITNFIHRNDRPSIISWNEIADIRRREHGCDARQSLCLGSINGKNPGVGIGTAENFSMQHSRNDQVAEKFCLAGNLFDSVNAWNTLADVFERLFCHFFSVSKYDFYRT